LLESPCIDLLPHLLSVPELPSRRLALRLLRARAGPFPWDLRDEPANAHFIAALSRRGIRMTPWIDGIGLAAEDTPRGRVFVQLERDPLEVLMMGKHFDTCLSPGWFNFFSAVSNAADVNKRVLYVRDEHGTVAGRCLLALDKDGRILTFHAYCHDSEGYAMLDVTRRFVLRLAQAMGTSIVTQGEVSCLLSHDWYDDGPEDIAGSFAPFAAGSDLRNWLTGAAPEELASGLRRHLDPLGVNALTLPLLLSLREVAERPELALPLLDEVERIDNISSDTMGRATMLCWRAHEHERARRFAFERLLPTLEQRCHPDRPPLPATLELLVELGAPSRVLRLIQRSRGRNVRQWSDEPDARRIFAAARAHQSLHRHKLAATLYRLALGRRSAHDLHPRCRQALTELGAHP
jgi:hypothetical protein